MECFDELPFTYTSFREVRQPISVQFLSEICTPHHTFPMVECHYISLWNYPVFYSGISLRNVWKLLQVDLLLYLQQFSICNLLDICSNRRSWSCSLCNLSGFVFLYGLGCSLLDTFSLLRLGSDEKHRKKYQIKTEYIGHLLSSVRGPLIRCFIAKYNKHQWIHRCFLGHHDKKPKTISICIFKKIEVKFF